MVTLRVLLLVGLVAAFAPLGSGGPVETGTAGCTVDHTGYRTVYASDPPQVDDCPRTIQSWSPVRSMLACRAPDDFAECKLFLTEYAADGTTVDGSVFVDCGPLGPDEPQENRLFVAEWDKPAMKFGSCFVRFQGETPTTWDNWDARCRGGQKMVCLHTRA